MSTDEQRRAFEARDAARIRERLLQHRAHRDGLRLAATGKLDECGTCRRTRFEHTRPDSTACAAFVYRGAL